MNEYMTIKEVSDYMRISKVTFFELKKSDSNFPKPVLSHKKQLWKRYEIDEYLEKTRSVGKEK
jgi:predicted DNA-binding transcriptional regulator AlpA